MIRTAKNIFGVFVLLAIMLVLAGICLVVMTALAVMIGGA